MNMKFSMEADVLSVLGKKTVTESEDLGALVRQLYTAAEALEGTFNGPGKAAFNRFKNRVDDISTTLNNSLVSITGSIAGQHTTFVNAADDSATVHTSGEGAADFAGADTSRFSGGASAV